MILKQKRYVVSMRKIFIKDDTKVSSRVNRRESDMFGRRIVGKLSLLVWRVAEEDQ